jgi:alpha-tubulin suppressor-like RCC1 family protein
MKFTLKQSLASLAACSLLALSACGGGGTSPATNNTATPTTITLPDLQGTVSGATRVVANKIYNYSATATTGMAGAYTVDWGDGTPSFSLAASSATQDKIWRAAGNYTASLSRTKSDGTVVTANQAVAVVDKPVSMGNKHSCSIMSDNTVSCWGDNTYGQLGNGTQVGSNSPLAVGGLTDVVSLGAYGFGTCAAKTDGTVWCWGQAPLNAGMGSIVKVPQQVPGLSGVIALAGGEYGTYSHVCALQRAGTVKCWGSNASGELGDGTALLYTGPGVNSTTPVSVTGLLDAKHIAAGGQTSCAIKADGSVLCWGFGYDGQVGPGAPTSGSRDSHIPVAVPNVSNAVSIAMSKDLSCAVLSDATVKCWGKNFSNQSSSAATSVAGVGNVAALTLGNKHACALKTDASVACWGQYNYAGAPALQTTPVAIVDASNAPLTNVLAVSSGLDHTCALKEDGSVFCWGLDDKGQLGDGLNVDRNTAGRVVDGQVVAQALQNSKTISAGDYHTCAIQATSKVACWGSNAGGQLGNGTTNQYDQPVEVLGLTGIVELGSGAYHTCALKNDGSVYCWGVGTNGQLGNGSNVSSSTPIMISNFNNVKKLSNSKARSMCAVTNSGDVYCWGKSENTLIQNNIPTLVTGISDVKSVSIGYYHRCALKNTGEIACWDHNGWSQSGQNYWVSTVNPTIINSSYTDFTSLSAGNAHTCAISTSAGLICWGMTQSRATASYSNDMPHVVTVPDGVKSVSSGATYTCSITNSSEVACWGDSDYNIYWSTAWPGTLISSPIKSNTPIKLFGLNNLAAVSTGMAHACVLKNTGSILCWGYGGNGQLGDGLRTNSINPVVVAGITSAVSSVTFWR